MYKCVKLAKTLNSCVLWICDQFKYFISMQYVRGCVSLLYLCTADSATLWNWLKGQPASSFEFKYCLTAELFKGIAISKLFTKFNENHRVPFKLLIC